MNATDTTSSQPAGLATAGRRIELYETAMCCQTGVCGPSVDEQLLTIRDDLRWAETQGATVARHNLTSNPDAFVGNPKITGLMQAFPENALPVLLIDGEIHLYGRYPTREDLATALQVTPQAVAEPVVEQQASGCCSPGESC